MLCANVFEKSQKHSNMADTLTIVLTFDTIKFLNIRTPKKFTVITLKFEQGGFTVE